MRKRFWYPKKEDVIENNKRVLEIVKADKSDRHKVLGEYKIDNVLEEAKKKKGDVFDKASVIVRGLNQGHPFNSANKRTAYFTANEFICKNKGHLILKKRDKQREMCIRIREGRVDDEDIAKWLRYADKNKIYGRDR